MTIKPASDSQIEHMKRFWDETPDKPALRPLNVPLIKKDFLSLIAVIEPMDVLDENDYRKIEEIAIKRKRAFFNGYACCDIPIQENFSYWVMVVTQEYIKAKGELTE